MKFCKKCNTGKSINEFYNNKNSKDGKTYMCISCLKIIAKNRRKTSRKWSSNLGLTKDEIREKNLKRMRDWVNKKRGTTPKPRLKKIIVFKIKKIKLNANERLDKTRHYHREYKRKKRLSDPLWKFKANMRTRVKNFFSSKVEFRKNCKTSEYLGAEYDFVKKHIEMQFSEGMNWNNNTNKGWHIDHIIPLSSAKTQEDVIKLLHYKNLQPLWAVDNMKKGATIIDVLKSDVIL